MVPIDLSGRIVLLTGATGKLGPTIALTLAQAGADLALVGKTNLEKAERVAEECRETGVRAEAFTADLSADDRTLRHEVLARVGRPAILVLGAAPSVPWKQALEQTPEEYQEMWEGVVGQAIRVVQAFAEDLPEDGSGRIIGLSTENASICGEGMSAYASAKRGLDGYLSSLAREFGPRRVTVNQVAPGWIDSGEDTPDWYRHRLALPARGTPQNVADAVLFLASDLAAFITGVWLPVAGGSVTTKS